jgi:hypothetical protein
MDAYRFAAEQIAKGVDFHAEKLYRESCAAAKNEAAAGSERRSS